MKQQRNDLLLACLATIVVAAAAGGVWAGVGAVMHVNSANNQSFPEQTRAGLLAAGDAGVNVMSGPVPSAIGQVPRITSLNPLTAQWQNIPDAGTVQLSNSVPPVGTFGGSGSAGTSTYAMRGNAVAPLPALPVGSTTGAGILQISNATPAAESYGATGAAGVGTAVSASDHVHALPALPVASTTGAGIVQFGTGTAQACSGAICAALGTLPTGSNAQVLAFSVTGTGQGTSIVAKTPSINAGNGIAIGGGSNPVTGLTISANIAASRNISTATASTTAISTATAVLGSDAQVVLPIASASQQGIAQVGSLATISSSTATATASSTAGAVCMPADATANGDHKVKADINSTPGYLVSQVECLAPLSCGDDPNDYKTQFQVWGASTSAVGVVQLDPNAPAALDGGPAVVGSRGLAADSGNKPKLGGNSPTPRQALIGGACSSTSTGTATGTAINFCSLQETDIAGLSSDLTARPTCTGAANEYMKFAGTNSCSTALMRESSTQPYSPGSLGVGMGTSNLDYEGPAGYSAIKLGTRGMLFFSLTDTADQMAVMSNAYLDGSTVWRYLVSGPASAFSAQSGSVVISTAPSGTAGAAITWTTQATISSTGIAGSNITATPTASAIPKADGSGTLNSWVTNHVSAVTTVTNSSPLSNFGSSYTVAVSTSLGGATTNTFVIGGTATVNSGVATNLYAKITIGGSLVGEPTESTFWGSGFVTIVNNQMVQVAGGTYTIALRLACDSSVCSLADGEATLVVTQYN